MVTTVTQMVDEAEEEDEGSEVVSGKDMMAAHRSFMLQLLRGRNERKIGNNTWARLHDDGEVTITLHRTVILRSYPDWTLTLNSGGYRTVTTKSRLEEYLPKYWRLYQEKGIWHLAHFLSEHGFNGSTEDYVFADGMSIGPDGEVHGAGDAGRASRLAKLGPKISTFANAYAEALVAGNVPRPGLGDCLYCSHDFNPGYSTADMHAGSVVEHLLSHMEESYFVPSLLVRAIDYKGGLLSPIARQTLHELWYGDAEARNQALGRDYYREVVVRQVAAVLKAYLRKEVDLTS